MSHRLQSAVEAQVAAGAPGALARVEAPRVGLVWAGSAGYLARDGGRALGPGDAFRVASATKSVTAVVVVRLAGEGRLALDEPLSDQLAPELLDRWRALDALPRTTARQLLTHTAGVPNYFGEESFMARVREEPGRVWRPVELVDHAAAHGTPPFRPGQGFRVLRHRLCDHRDPGRAGRRAGRCTRSIASSSSTRSAWTTRGSRVTSRREARSRPPLHGRARLDDDLPTIDWAGGGLVTTAPTSLASSARSGRDRSSTPTGLSELTRWTPGASFPPGGTLRYDRYGLGMGASGSRESSCSGTPASSGPSRSMRRAYDAVLVGTHNDSQVDRWPLVAALCRELGDAA